MHDPQYQKQSQYFSGRITAVRSFWVFNSSMRNGAPTTGGSWWIVGSTIVMTSELQNDIISLMNQPELVFFLTSHIQRTNQNTFLYDVIDRKKQSKEGKMGLGGCANVYIFRCGLFCVRLLLAYCTVYPTFILHITKTKKEKCFCILKIIFHIWKQPQWTRKK